MTDIVRQKKVLGMMMTAHSVLRYRLLFWSLFTDIALIVASAILNVIIFIDEHYIQSVTRIDPPSQKVIAGFASVIVFTISIILLRVRWKEKAEDHLKAGEQLFNLMQECRRLETLEEGQTKEKAIKKFNEWYTQVFTAIVKIPDRKFNSTFLL